VPASVSAWEATIVWWSVVAAPAIWRAILDAAADCERAIFSCRSTRLLSPRRA